MYTSPDQLKTKRPKLSLTPQFDRMLRRAAQRSGFEYAPFLRELIEWSIVNGAIEAIQEEKQCLDTDSTAA